MDKIALGVLGLMLLFAVKNQIRRVQSAFTTGKTSTTETEESK